MLQFLPSVIGLQTLFLFPKNHLVQPMKFILLLFYHGNCSFIKCKDCHLLEFNFQKMDLLLKMSKRRDSTLLFALRIHAIPACFALHQFRLLLQHGYRIDSYSFLLLELSFFQFQLFRQLQGIAPI